MLTPPRRYTTALARGALVTNATLGAVTYHHIVPVALEYRPAYLPLPAVGVYGPPVPTPLKAL